MQITDEKRQIIEHSLGLSQAKKPYRNYYCSGEGCDGFDTLVEMEKEGLMRRRKSNSDIYGDQIFFHVTLAGHKAIGVEPEKE